MKVTLLLFFIFCSHVWASDLDRSPKSFKTSKGNAVFIDIKSATYEITYDLKINRATLISKIVFSTKDEGFPIFDSYRDPGVLELDGKPVKQKLIHSPGKVTKFRMILKKTSPGEHILITRSLYESEFIKKVDGGVRDEIKIDDYADRTFLEYFVPSNLEYDQYKMTFKYLIKNSLKKHMIYTNGDLTEVAENSFLINFPETTNCSSVFMSLAPVGLFKELKIVFNTLVGTSLPITIFTDDKKLDLIPAANETLRVLSELENDFGTFPHKGLVIEYIGDVGYGMEYAGAAYSGFTALDHEIMHNYFGRRTMPANGNAGWFDEAIANWYEAGFPSKNLIPDREMFATGSPYLRMTEVQGDMGVGFMTYLDFKLSSKGGLKPFLRHFVENYKFVPYTTEDVIKLISDFYGEDLSGEFKKFVY